MEQQSSSPSYRPRGCSFMKAGLQVALFLAVCLWLTYQIKNSHDKQSYGSTQKLIDGRLLLGRKGDVGGFIVQARIELEAGNLVREDEENISLQSIEAGNTRDGGMGYVVHIFDDENGVPPGALLHSLSYQPRGRLHHEIIASSNDHR